MSPFCAPEAFTHAVIVGGLDAANVAASPPARAAASTATTATLSLTLIPLPSLWTPCGGTAHLFGFWPEIVDGASGRKRTPVRYCKARARRPEPRGTMT